MTNDTAPSTSITYRSGDGVYFFDPDGNTSSGYYTVTDAPAPEDQFDDSVIKLADESGAEVEAFPSELAPVQGALEAAARFKVSMRPPREVFMFITMISLTLLAGVLLLVLGASVLTNHTESAAGLLGVIPLFGGVFLMHKAWIWSSSALLLSAGLPAYGMDA